MGDMSKCAESMKAHKFQKHAHRVSARCTKIALRLKLLARTSNVGVLALQAILLLVEEQHRMPSIGDTI